jgi:siroheme synthase
MCSLCGDPIDASRLGVIRYIHFRAWCGGSGADLDWASLAGSRRTLVVYMGMKTAPLVAHQLIQNGLDPATSVALIENGTRPNQKVVIGTLNQLETLSGRGIIGAPALIVIGEVVRLYGKSRFRLACRRMLATAA